jgi:flagellar biosynthesis protein FlhG
MTGGKKPGRFGGTRIIAITSGKGGVGKTSLAVNLGIELSRKGLRVLILDCDFGLSNVDVLLGTTSRMNLTHVLSGECSLRDVITTGPYGLRFIAGGSGALSLLSISHWQLEGVLEQLRDLEDETDMILLDTGAGVNDNILSLISAADDAIFVITPEPTSVMDAYALVKAVLHYDRLPRLLALVNRAENAAEADAILQKFCAVVRLYLDTDIRSAGYILADEAVVRAIRAQKPFVIMSPRSAAARNIDSVAWGFMRDNIEIKPGAIQGFFNRLWKRKG